MDLGTVRVGRLFTPLFLSYLLVVSIIISLFQTQLESGHYETPQDFAEDMRLVWYNALLYNPKGSDIHELTKEMQETFERAYEPIYRDWEKNARVHEERQRRRREKDLQRKAKAAETGTEAGGGDGGGDRGGTKDAEGGATVPTPTTATTTTTSTTITTDWPMEGGQYRQEEINAVVPLEYAAGEQLTTAASLPIPLAPTMMEAPPPQQLEGNNQGDAAVAVAMAVDSSSGESVGGGVAVEMDVEQHPTTKETGGEKEARQEAESMQGTTMTTTTTTTTTDSMGIGESSNGASMPGLGPQGLLPAATEEPTQRPEQPQQPQQPGVPELTSTPPPTFLGT